MNRHLQVLVSGVVRGASREPHPVRPPKVASESASEVDRGPETPEDTGTRDIADCQRMYRRER